MPMEDSVAADEFGTTATALTYYDRALGLWRDQPQAAMMGYQQIENSVLLLLPRRTLLM